MIKLMVMLMIFGSSASSFTVFDFSPSSSLERWRIVDDVVMGGKSSGTLQLSEEGHGVFEGTVSLENNGGFSSLRYDPGTIQIENQTMIRIRLKGDGKNYQIRLKANRTDYQSYIKTFSTTGDWEEITIPLKNLYPSYRGKVLDMPNFSSDQIQEVTLLIANKRNEHFKLIIDRIELI